MKKECSNCVNVRLKQNLNGFACVKDEVQIKNVHSKYLCPDYVEKPIIKTIFSYPITNEKDLNF